MLTVLNEILHVILIILCIVNCLVWFDVVRICWHKTFSMLKPEDEKDGK